MAAFSFSFFNKKISIAFAAFTLAIAFAFGLNFNGYYGQDSYAYWSYVIQLQHYFLTGEKPSPFFWPVVYPMIGSLFSLLYNNMVVLQIISCTAFAITIYLVCDCLEILTNKKHNSLFVFITLVLSPYFFRLAVCSMSDMTCTLFCVATLRYFLLQQKQNNYFFIGTMACAALAFFTRYAAAILLLPLIIASGISFLKNFNLKIFGLALLVLVMIITINLFFNNNLINNTFHHPLFENWNVVNFFKTDFATASDGFHHYTLINLFAVLSIFYHPGFSIFIPLLLILMFWKKKPIVNAVSLICVFMYMVFLAGLPEQNTRLLTLCFPFVVVSFYSAANFSFTDINFRLKKIVLPVYFIISMVMIWFALKPIATMSKNEKAVISYIKTQPDSITIYTTGLTAAFKAYEINNPVIELWSEKPLTNFNSKCFLVFDEKIISGQWKETMVANNILALKNQISLLNQPLLPDTIIAGYSIYSK